ncbi:hypothetical protein [Saccharothrix lopnurensis]|uniref:Uncharacterized protein n=1 Tax=Saccharothrix lopnurensis TaxID=1670621 RepID=A0ABW1PCS3_9PSEU
MVAAAVAAVGLAVTGVASAGPPEGRSRPAHGDADGFQTRAAITADGRAVTVAVTNDEAHQYEVLAFFDKALCATK